MIGIQYSSILTAGFLIGFGLAFSGATESQLIFSFLHFQELGFIIMYLVVVCVSLVMYRIVPGLIGAPLFDNAFRTEYRFFSFSGIAIGGVCFGVGIALTGFGPTTVFPALGSGNFFALYTIVGIVSGVILSAGFLKD